VRTATAVERGYIVRLLQLSALGFIVPHVHVDVADLNFEVRRAERRILVEKIVP
jgi:hypothetical protein